MKTSTIGLGVAGAIGVGLVYLWVKKDGVIADDAVFKATSLQCMYLNPPPDSAVVFAVTIQNIGTQDGNFTCTVTDADQELLPVTKMIPAGESEVFSWTWYYPVPGVWHPCAVGSVGPTLCGTYTVPQP